jgi:hypothetical protein
VQGRGSTGVGAGSLAGTGRQARGRQGNAAVGVVVGRSVVRGLGRVGRWSWQSRRTAGTDRHQEQRDSDIGDCELGDGKGPRLILSSSRVEVALPCTHRLAVVAPPANEQQGACTGDAPSSLAAFLFHSLARTAGARAHRQQRASGRDQQPVVAMHQSRRSRRGVGVHQQPPPPPRAWRESQASGRSSAGLADTRARLSGLARSPSAHSLNAPRTDWTGLDRTSPPARFAYVRTPAPGPR